MYAVVLVLLCLCLTSSVATSFATLTTIDIENHSSDALRRSRTNDHLFVSSLSQTSTTPATTTNSPAALDNIARLAEERPTVTDDDSRRRGTHDSNDLFRTSSLSGFSTDRITANRLFQYTFDESTTSLPLAADGSVSPVGPLVASQAGAVFRSDGIGLQFASGGGDRLVSNLTVAPLLSLLAAGDFAVELWVKVNASDSGMPLLVVGAYASAGAAAPPLGCIGYDLAIVQSGRSITCTAQTTGDNCATVSRSFVLGADAWPVHIVCARDAIAGTLYLYVNGVTSALQFAGGALPWTPTNKLHIGRQTTATTWKGDVYLVAMYASFLSLTDARANYNAYLPNSAPHLPVYDDFTNVVRLGEMRVENITLLVYDFDIAMNATWPAGVKPTSLRPDPLTYTLGSIPAFGTLYNSIDALTFVPLNVTNLPYTIPYESSGRVWYRSPDYTFGDHLASFSYRVSDGIVTTTSRSVPINVYFINNPPRAVNSSQFADAQYPSLLTLDGLDPDNTVDGEFSGTAYLDSLPTHGTLRQITSPTVPIVNLTTPILVLNDALQVIYVSEPAAATTSGLDVVFQDSFLFHLVDFLGAPSANQGTIAINVRNGLRPLEQTSGCIEDTPCFVQLEAIDRLGTFPLTYIIISLPTNGTLWQYGSNATSPLTASMLPITVTDRNASLWYQARSNWNGLERFTFRVHRGTYSSYVGTMSLAVAAVNDAPTITGPTRVTVAFLSTLSVNLVIDDVDWHTGVAPTSQIYYAEIHAGIRSVRMSLATSQLNQLTFSLGDGATDPDMLFSGDRLAVWNSFFPLKIGSVDRYSDRIRILITDSDATIPLTTTFEIAVTTTSTGTETTSTEGAVAPTILYVIWGSTIFITLICFAFCIHRYLRYRRVLKQEQQYVIGSSVGGLIGTHATVLPSSSSSSSSSA